MKRTKQEAADRRLPVPVEVVERRIYSIRGQKVMLSPDLADLYQVETRVVVQAVKRNLDRFPQDFMFQLTPEEFELLKSQIVISSWGLGCTGQHRDHAGFRQTPGSSCYTQGSGREAG